jgi:uncharacterized protein (TIGR02145 family)
MKNTFTFVFIIFSIFAFAQVPGAVPTNGLIAYWPFDGNANDVSGNAKNGTVTGATLTSDRFGSANSAYNFSGVTQFITCPNISELNGSSSASFSLWVKINGNNSWLNNPLGSAQYILSRDGDQSTTNIGINYGPGNKLFGGRIGRNGSGTGVGSTNTYNIPQSTWHHIVFTIGGGFLKLYVDGVFNSSTVFNGVMPSSSGNLFFGKLPVGGFEYYLNGFLDDIGIWNRALTATEITNLYNITAVSIATPPVAASTQTFCGSATVADLTATGTNLKWYEVPTGGVALSSSAVLVTGTYYVSQTTETNESTRTTVAVTIIPTTAPTASASQTFCANPAPTIASLTATGTAIQWYAVATGGTTLASTTALITGTTYYASQTVGTCESARTAVIVSINDSTITASATTVCAGTAVNLNATTTLQGTSVLPSNLQNGLMAFYPFNGNANDTSINGNNPTVNTIQYTSDRNGNANSAGLFLGQQYAIVPNSSSLNVSGDFSVASWVYLNNDFPLTGWWNTKAIFTKNNDYPYGAKVFITPDEDSLWISFGTSMWDANQGFSKRILRSELLGAWHHFTWTYDNNVGKLFLDGTLILSQSATPNWSNANTLDLHIAVNGDPAGNYPYKFVGKMDDLGLWSRSLSSSEITELSSVQSYLWSTGETTATINPTPSATTTYWCDVKTNGVTCRKEITITVNPNIVPTFTQVAPICSVTTLAQLPTTSNNGITGTWSPPINNTTTTTYTFTPTAGQCASTTTQTITITAPKVTSAISFVAPVAALPSVTIGTQVWTNKNLDVTTYRDGTPIPQVTDPTAWANLTTGAWCYYNNDPSNNSVYGKLYNWYAVNDPRGLAPAGYHVPSEGEWSTLTSFLGGDSVAGGKMKSTGTLQASSGLWQSPNSAATNESGFTGHPAGYRSIEGTFMAIGGYGFWWSSSEINTAEFEARSSYLGYDDDSAYSSTSHFKKSGFSVRCIKN